VIVVSHPAAQRSDRCTRCRETQGGPLLWGSSKQVTFRRLVAILPDRLRTGDMSKLGGRGVHGFTTTARRAAHVVRAARANAHAADLAPILKELQATGITSLNGIAAAFNAREVPTPAGSGHWHAMQVARVLKRLAMQRSCQRG
jgi:hypothetical protein